MNQSNLESIFENLRRKSGHENVRVQIQNILTQGLGIDSSRIQQETNTVSFRGRIDTLLGLSIFEFKSNLDKERPAAEEQLQGYLADRESDGNSYTGIATDGAEYAAYILQDSRVEQINSIKPANLEQLLDWLRRILVLDDSIQPNADNIEKELGRESPTCQGVMLRLKAIYHDLSNNPQAKLKYDIWRQLMETVHGKEIDDHQLFIQHTYLTYIAKAIATWALTKRIPGSAKDLLEGKEFIKADIEGAVESDLFDWPLLHPKGDSLLTNLTVHIQRFSLGEVKTDILKVLYESLLDKTARHGLGEYYTPDWLAERICEQAIDKPLEQRVLDPSCGSGTFLFHAIKRLMAAAKQEGLSNKEILNRVSSQVIGLDIHPVAVMFARTTWLLAAQPLLGEGRGVSVPVYLGDAMQWNTHAFLGGKTVEVDIPGENTPMRFPASLPKDQAAFGEILRSMLKSSEQNAQAEIFKRWLDDNQNHLSSHDKDFLKDAYDLMRRLNQQGRNHIWGFVVRNLVHPIWISAEDNKVDVLVGNPPWLAYRYMSSVMQKKFKHECSNLNIWAGGKHSANQDLAGYFFIRSAELFLKPTGCMAMVMPFAALSRPQYFKFWQGSLNGDNISARLQCTEAWSLDKVVHIKNQQVEQPFPTKACVIFSRLSADKGKTETRLHPQQIWELAGELPRRNANNQEAQQLQRTSKPWPPRSEVAEGSEYRSHFYQGASLIPRRLVFIERKEGSSLEGDRVWVSGLAGEKDKLPWKHVPVFEGQVDTRFIYPVHLGKTLLPFRLLDALEAVIPWDENKQQLMNAPQALDRTYIDLVPWLKHSEETWEEYRQTESSTFQDWIDYHGKLSKQFPTTAIRVLYNRAGTYLCAAILRDKQAVVESSLYWCQSDTMEEAYYLTGILNSETMNTAIAPYQSRGQFGPRDIHKTPFNMDIPMFNNTDSLHQAIVDSARKLEAEAAKFAIDEGKYFAKLRTDMRHALKDIPSKRELEHAVKELLEARAA